MFGVPCQEIKHKPGVRESKREVELYMFPWFTLVTGCSALLNRLRALNVSFCISCRYAVPSCMHINKDCCNSSTAVNPNWHRTAYQHAQVVLKGMRHFSAPLTGLTVQNSSGIEGIQDLIETTPICYIMQYVLSTRAHVWMN